MKKRVTSSVVPSQQLGAPAVFLTALSTILGAILFLRFGYAVGNVGLAGALAIVLLGHVVTVPTAMAVAEIATNQRVAGGGAYYIVSRSFGVVIGAAIGITLYLSQAISVAFYAIAFAEAFKPLWLLVERETGVLIDDPRIISLPTVIILGLLTFWKGAWLGVKALYLVVAILAASLLLFFLGAPLVHTPDTFVELWTEAIPDGDNFFYVFAIIFPAFTGIAAGLGLSGDLRDARTAIPLGTLAATIVGGVVYVGIAFKLAMSATPAQLAGNQLIMEDIALWGPIIPIGLAAATLSSAVGSILVAPRTLQALGVDRIFPSSALSRWLARGRKGTNEPYNGILVTSAIAIFFVMAGDVNFVAEIISMFFMVTYGAICVISFLEHFAADPTYRPSFRSRWYLSLLGAIACGWLMLLMNALYAFLAVLLILGTYLVVARYNPNKRGLANLFQGAIFQLSRQLQVFLQKSDTSQSAAWRPAVVCISKRSFERVDAFDLLRWISHRYGFGTYIHYIEGYLSKATGEQATQDLERLVRQASASGSRVFVDTLVCPSTTSAVAQVVQLPGISGKENNMLLFEADLENGGLEDLVHNYQLVAASGFDVCLLLSSSRGFGYRHNIHIWLTQADLENANLMILLAYIILGHPDWRRARIRIFVLSGEAEQEMDRENLARMIKDGRLPISQKNIEQITMAAGANKKEIISENSADADLTIIGFRGEALKRMGKKVFEGYEGSGNILFVNTTKEIEIDRPAEAPVDEEETAATAPVEEGEVPA